MAAVGSELTASVNDPDGGVTGITWLWERYSLTPTPGWVELDPGQDSTTYTPPRGDLGGRLRVRADPYTDGHGPGKSAQNTSVDRVVDVPDAPGDLSPAAGDRSVTLSSPDYVVGVTGSNGALTKEFYWRWTGSAWDKKEGADIPEVDIAFATRYLEGALDWKRLDIPDTDRHHLKMESYNQRKAVRVSKGEFRDYVPNDDYALGGQILPSAVEPDTWGGIKSQ